MAMYDAVIIGGGPGGYTCAIRIAQLGGKAALVEKGELGGCCVNHGCIPTKSLYESAKVISKAKRMGLIGTESAIDFDGISRLKERSVKASMLGVEQLLESHGVKVFKGTGRLVDSNKVEAGQETIEAKSIVIATGSAPATIAGVEIDHNTVIDSTDLLGMQKLPKDIIICGGGVIGAEFACILNRLGVKVMVVEMLPRLVALQDIEVSGCLESEMKRDGIDILTSARVERIAGNTVEVAAGGQKSKLTAEKILMAIGRRPVFDMDELDRIGVRHDKGITVDPRMRTSVKNIYAVGDVTNTGMLAYVASAQGEVAAKNIMGVDSIMDYNAIPSTIFTFPEIGSVGETSQDAKGAKTGKAQFAASGKARLMGEVRGFVKVVARDGRLVGAHIIGPDATELIAEAALAVKNRLGIRQIRGVIHSHPTLAESFLEAVRDIDNEAINIPKK